MLGHDGPDQPPDRAPDTEKTWKMSLFISLTIAALALLFVLVIAAASSYPIPARHVSGAQSTTKPTTDPFT